MDVLIRNGRIIDPANGVDQKLDILVKNGRISYENNANPVEIIDANDLLVCPGLIDAHIHAYQFSTPLGIDVDQYCLARGVTCALDAGSAGVGWP